MPNASRGSKRTLEEIVMQEDSNDEDYDDQAPGPAKSRSSRIRRSDGHVRKKQKRVRYRGSDVDSDDDEIESDDEESFDEESEDDEIETNERGRPVRKTVKKAITYEESPSEEDELSRSSSEDSVTAKPVKKKRLIVKLKTGGTPAKIPQPPARSLRNRSGSYGMKQPTSSAPTHAPPARRSSRLSHDPDEPVVALTNSGNHVEIVRAGSRDPEGIPPRALKGGKGIKHPSKSTIDEEPESVETKEEDIDEMEIKASQNEVTESDHHTQFDADDELPKNVPGIQGAADEAADNDTDLLREESPNQDDEDDEGPVSRGRSTRTSTKRKASSPFESPEGEDRLRRRNLRSAAAEGASRSRRRKAQDESSDFDPQNEPDREENLSSSSESEPSQRKQSQRNDDYDSSNNGRRSNRLRGKALSRQRSPATEEDEDLAAEVAELKRDGKKKRSSREEILFEPRGTRRAVKKPNYDLLRNLPTLEDEEEPAPSPSQRPRKPGGGSWQRSLFSTYGPFGGAGGLAPLLGGPSGPRAQGDVESDSSDDEVMKQPRPVGGTVGMTPTTAGGFNIFPQNLNADPAQATAGTPANLGKIKDRQALADADPLGVDQNVNFDSVGGLQQHIDQLKEMVSLPLLYPEIFMRFHITPPRGVLFHGPPGTGKTLLARALASSVSSQGRKVTFYMRKGADALSKWVGEAERQLRLLFEEARKTQPSIIFFDEIDGLAPVRSSKQEQIHASIVSTLLALMDGMDGRGQVIVIGATNRPDSIDPALRRPGRFDREFYFPLPNTDARRSILDIHTKGWDPPLDPAIKDELALLTKGYGGADLRALCTEAALNAVQRRYPQIYASNEKLVIDPKTIEVTPRDFMISVKKMVPSSERSTSSGAAPLPESIAPLLLKPLNSLKDVLAELLPQKKKLTALQEAEFEDITDGRGFGRERMQQAFESSRVFRPRLLIHGRTGMGQQYLAAALLNHFEGLHVQSFDLPTLLSDTASSPEATVIRLFSEVKMHKPSVIFIPNVQEWYATVGQTVLSTFLGLLRSIKPTDPVLLLGVVEHEDEHVDETMRRELFGYSKRNQFFLTQPSQSERLDYFRPLKSYIRHSPSDFPEPENRKKRHLEKLAVAPPEPDKSVTLSKEEQKAQKKRDRQTLNMLKIRLQPIMDQIRTRHKKFRTGVIDETQIRYLYEEADPGTVTSDLHTELLARASFRPFEVGKDPHGVPGLIDQSNMRFYYNLDSVTIEKRLSNGYYKRPKDFLADIKRLAKDAKTIEDDDRLLKANELLANVEVDIGGIEFGEPAFTAECERVYQRELAREKEALEKAKAAAANNKDMPPPQVVSNVPHNEFSASSTVAVSDGPVFLGEPIPRGRDLLSRFQPITPSRPASHSTILTNGIHVSTGAKVNAEMMNGSGSLDAGHEADIEGDTPMEGVDSQPPSHEKSNETQPSHTTSSFGNRESAQPRPFHSYTAPSQHLRRESGMSAPLSQTGGITPMAAGSQAADYQNDASTTQTTSGKKYSGPSTGEKEHATQDSGPNLFVLDERRSAGGSEIPDTQEEAGETQHSQNSVAGFNSNPSQSQPTQAQTPSSQGPNRSSQPPVPPFDASTARPPQQQARPNGQLQDLLNPQPQPNLVQVEDVKLDNTYRDIAYKTSGLSIEQLEQVNSVLMDTLWQTRGEWDRRKVLDQVADAFNAVMEDMQDAGQDFGSSSWGRTQR